MKPPIRIELPSVFAYSNVNTFLFIGDEPTLIDCGENSPEGLYALEEGLKTHHVKLADIKKIIITHAHIDHMGLAGNIAHKFGAEVWVSDLVLPWAIAAEKCIFERADLLRNIFTQGSLPSYFLEPFVQSFKSFRKYWVNIPSENIKVFQLNDTLHFGGKDWQPIFAPGHSITQTCFYQADAQFLLSADAILAQTPVAVLEIDDSQNDGRLRALPQMLDTFKMLADLEIQTVFPGHGNSFENHKQLLAYQTERIYQRTEETLNYIKAGSRTAFDIAQKLYPAANPPQFFIGFTMTLGYLDLLEAKHLIQSEEKQGVYHYSLI